WDPVARVVTVSVGGHTARLPVGATTAVVDGQSMPLSAPLHIVNGRTQVPLPLLAQLLNLRLEWVQEGQEAILR
ncbi:MAG: hypothetical protein IRY95_06735, partial [Clostridia bacterium]|nr:hypothetical protein [Clostridia bacterium]